MSKGSNMDVKRLQFIAENFEKRTRVFNKETRKAIAKLRTIWEKNLENTKDGGVREGDVFVCLSSGETVIASTISDSNFKRYLKYPWGTPAGAVEDKDLLNPKLFFRDKDERFI